VTNISDGLRRLLRQGAFCASRGESLVKSGVVMMVMAMYDHHNLALRHIGHCKAEKEN
jgi:hypothetical protein